MPRTRIDAAGRLAEIPPAMLDCGHPYGPGLVTIGYQPHPTGGRARSYYCRTCRHVTFDDPDTPPDGFTVKLLALGPKA